MYVTRINESNLKLETYKNNNRTQHYLHVSTQCKQYMRSILHVVVNGSVNIGTIILERIVGNMGNMSDLYMNLVIVYAEPQNVQTMNSRARPWWLVAVLQVDWFTRIGRLVLSSRFAVSHSTRQQQENWGLQGAGCHTWSTRNAWCTNVGQKPTRCYEYQYLLSVHRLAASCKWRTVIIVHWYILLPCHKKVLWYIPFFPNGIF